MARGLSSIPAPRVRVNCVTPGITMTPMGQDTINALEQDYTKNKILFRRYATPEEIALYRLFSQPGKKLPDRRDGGCQRRARMALARVSCSVRNFLDNHGNANIL